MAGTFGGNATLWFGALIMAAAVAVHPALADDDDDDKKKNFPVISEVFVSFGDPGFDTKLTINGANLLGRSKKERTRVMLGTIGPLEILSSSDTELVVRCFVHGPPDFACEDGDYNLRVMIVEVEKKGWKDDDRGRYMEEVKSVASYALTIGAVGPQGVQGEKGDRGEQGMTGLKGDKGDPGEPGKTGDKGDKGDPGDPGMTGPKGDKGDPGDDGKDGAVGPIGPPGPVAAIGTSCPAGQAVIGLDVNGALICATVSAIPLVLCAEGVIGEQFSLSMAGCRGKVIFDFRATLCGPKARVCTAEDWVNLRGGSTPRFHYWTDDVLQANGNSASCYASATEGGGCAPDAPMHVCAPTLADELGNQCNWQQCGFETTTPNEHFGGCAGNNTAGTLCCAG